MSAIVVQGHCLIPDSPSKRDADIRLHCLQVLRRMDSQPVSNLHPVPKAYFSPQALSFSEFSTAKTGSSLRPPSWVYEPGSWGLSAEVTSDMANSLLEVWQRYRRHFRNRTRDPSKHAFTYLRGLLTMRDKRTIANIARRVNGAQDDGQNLQNFMTESPWSSRPVLEQIQTEVAGYHALLGESLLIIDESANKRLADKSAGVSRQHNGRLGRQEDSQVGVFLTLASKNAWCLLDAELYLAKEWFTPQKKELWDRLRIPQDREFKKKSALAINMLLRIRDKGIHFEAVAADEGYGRDGWFREQLQEHGFIYMVGIPLDTQVYLKDPQKYPRAPAVRVQQIAGTHRTQFETIHVRDAERGPLDLKFYMQQVWVIPQGYLHKRNKEPAPVRKQWLIIQEEKPYQYRYSLSNAPEDTPKEKLAFFRQMRYFVERVLQDGKSEMGMEDFQAQKYPAWEHHITLTALASWFAAEFKLRHAQQHPPDPCLKQALGVVQLPSLSLGNMRELLAVAMPLPHLNQQEACRLVTQHLVHRSRTQSSHIRRENEPASKEQSFPFDDS